MWFDAQTNYPEFPENSERTEKKKFLEGPRYVVMVAFFWAFCAFYLIALAFMYLSVLILHGHEEACEQVDDFLTR